MFSSSYGGYLFFIFNFYLNNIFMCFQYQPQFPLLSRLPANPYSSSPLLFSKKKHNNKMIPTDILVYS